MMETEKRYACTDLSRKRRWQQLGRVKSFHHIYILGMEFAIETDHKPLFPLLGTMYLDCLPPRIFRFRVRLSRFNYFISHIPGRVVSAATTLQSLSQRLPTGRVRRNRQHLNPIPENSVNDNSRRDHFVREPIMTRSRTGTTIQPPKYSAKY